MVRFGIIESPEEVVGLLEDVFPGEWPWAEYVEWMNACPNGSNRWYGAFDSGKAVAMYGLLPMVVRSFGKIVSAALCNSVGTHPDYRGQGLFVDLGKYALEDMKPDVALGVPNSQAAPGHRKVGWCTVGRLILMEGELEDNPSLEYSEALKHVPDNSEATFRVVRDPGVFKWRYSKPGQVYRQTFCGDDHIIWKEFKGYRQVLSASYPSNVMSLGGKVAVWAFDKSRAYKFFRTHGFERGFERDFIMYPGTDIQVPTNLNSIRFELCDSDVF